MTVYFFGVPRDFYSFFPSLGLCSDLVLSFFSLSLGAAQSSRSAYCVRWSIP